MTKTKAKAKKPSLWIAQGAASGYWIVFEGKEELERFDTRGGAEQYLAKLLKSR